MLNFSGDLGAKLLYGMPPTKTNIISLANDINNGFLEPQQVFEPLQACYRLATTRYKVLTLAPEVVARVLITVNTTKTGGPDRIPNWVLRDYTYELAYPVSTIINSSLGEGILPDVWKCTNVIPIPKVSKVEDIKKDLRANSCCQR